MEKYLKFTVAIFLIFKMQLCPPDCHVLSPKTFKTYYEYLCQRGSLNSPAIHNHRRPNANKFVFVLPKWKVCESTTTNQKVHVLPTTTPIPDSYRPIICDIDVVIMSVSFSSFRECVATSSYKLLLLWNDTEWNEIYLVVCHYLVSIVESLENLFLHVLKTVKIYHPI